MKRREHETPAIIKRMIIGLIIIFVVVLAFVGVKILQLKGQVANYREYWQQQSQKAPEETSRQYIALGDSSAQGIGASHPTKSYVGRIKTEVESLTSQTVVVHNLSVSGAKVADVTQQLSKLEAMKLEDNALVTLTIGGNDMREFTPYKFETELRELFSRLPRQTVVGDIAYFGGGRYRRYEPNVIKANEILHRVADEHQLVVASVHHFTKRGDSRHVYSIDFFHPSDRGYYNWYQAFMVKLGAQL